MKKHFSPEKTPKHEVRYIIFQMMDHFENMDSIVTRMLSLEIPETKALDQIEERLIKMEKLHLRMSKLVKALEKDQSIGEEVVYESSPFYEAIRRTSNLLTGFNKLDLNSSSWVSRVTRCLVDRVYYRQIKSLIYKGVEEESEEK